MKKKKKPVKSNEENYTFEFTSKLDTKGLKEKEIEKLRLKLSDPKRFHPIISSALGNIVRSTGGLWPKVIWGQWGEIFPNFSKEELVTNPGEELTLRIQAEIK